MAAAIIKERYYILTPLSFLLGALVLITTPVAGGGQLPAQHRQDHRRL